MRNRYTKLHDTLKQWYEKEGRKELPWRQTHDPYKIYLSEMMLQQTTVKTVLERFYHPFLERFPTFYDLSQVSLEEVLKMWEGLGYYRRARYIHASAHMCQGVFPSTFAELQSLKGVGKTTAHAIGAFAFGEKLPILDANVKRVLSRFFGLQEVKESVLWEKAYDLLDRDDPYRYNQAMMDVGAMVCRVSSPLCEMCPLEKGCQGRENPLAFKVLKTKQKQPTFYHKMVIPLSSSHTVLLSKREGEFLHGLWGFELIPAEACEWSFQKRVYPLTDKERKGAIRQVYTHFIVEAEVFCVEVEGDERFFSFEEVAKIPLSKIDQKGIALL